jgi:methionine-rich copper-binding protein CopC
MKVTKGILAALLLQGSMLLAATQAHAQEMYDTSIPSQGDVLKEAPTPMVLNFSEAIYLTNVRVVGADGTVWPLDWQKSEENIFKAEFRVTKPLPPGEYQIEWTAYVRQHFHSDGGVITFKIDQP